MMTLIMRWWCQKRHTSPANLRLVQFGNIASGTPALWECQRCWQRWRWPA